MELQTQPRANTNTNANTNTHTHADTQTNRQTDRHAGRQTGRQAKRQTRKHAGMRTHTHTQTRSSKALASFWVIRVIQLESVLLEYPLVHSHWCMGTSMLGNMYPALSSATYLTMSETRCISFRVSTGHDGHVARGRAFAHAPTMVTGSFQLKIKQLIWPNPQHDYLGKCYCYYNHDAGSDDRQPSLNRTDLTKPVIHASHRQLHPGHTNNRDCKGCVRHGKLRYRLDLRPGINVLQSASQQRYVSCSTGCICPEWQIAASSTPGAVHPCAN